MNESANLPFDSEESYRRYLFVSFASVQEHGGEMTVESPSTALRAGEPGQWTRLCVDLPVEGQ
jgi:hypothetical protein